MRLLVALTEFGYSKDHTLASRQWYRSRLGAFTAWLEAQGIADIEDITAPLVRRYLDHRRTAPAKGGNPLDSHTLHGHARAIRALLNWAVREDLLNEHVVKRLVMPKREYKVIPTLSQRQIDLLFAACDRGEIPEYVTRDRAILALLLDTGMRASELCGLTLDRVIFTPDEAYCLVHSKGCKQREVGLGRLARQALHRYIHRYRSAARTAPNVFVAKGGTPLTAEGLDRLLYRLRDRAGLGAVRVSAHVWRHTYALRYLEQGGDIYRLSRLMGHSSVATTEGYLRAFNSRQARLQGKSVLDSLGRAG